MVWCCLLAHGERRLGRVMSNFSGSWRASRQSFQAVSVEKQPCSDGFVVGQDVSGPFLVAVDGILALLQVQPLTLDTIRRRAFFFRQSLHICRATTILTITFVNTHGFSRQNLIYAVADLVLRGPLSLHANQSRQFGP